ncbi:MAG: hypothetical protein QM788_17505 [Roseateles sp.]|uniref:hypothetical protein n=1 Tax=Roseateles sp. TaxID=1971397 RepID=UPI0039EA6321
MNKSGYFDIGTKASASPVVWGCSGNCEVVFDGESPAGSSLVDGVKHWYAKGAYVNTGKKCSASAEAGKQVGSAASAVPPDGCKPGQGAGTINGKTVCFDQSGDDHEVDKSSEDKSTTKTEKTVQENPDGSKTTTETTTRTGADGIVETTTTRTTVRPDGSSVTESESTTNKPPGKDDGKDEGDDESSECKKNSSASGCGGEPANIGSLYHAKGKTLDSVLASARDSFLSTPIGTAAGRFLVVSAAGTCPSWSGTIPYIDAEFSIDQFCSSFASSALAILKVCILVVASFFAFRISIGD